MCVHIYSTGVPDGGVLSTDLCLLEIERKFPLLWEWSLVSTQCSWRPALVHAALFLSALPFHDQWEETHRSVLICFFPHNVGLGSK